MVDPFSNDLFLAFISFVLFPSLPLSHSGFFLLVLLCIELCHPLFFSVISPVFQNSLIPSLTFNSCKPTNEEWKKMGKYSAHSSRFSNLQSKKKEKDSLQNCDIIGENK